ncbi:hypothetical protein [Cupriavidus taiwanensis]|uniref:hypothetical protein n=1 Tax=Cupriavidus taiwanensis TaxID=164546 RepID=UPI0015F26545|nr:hypothetical protein [Cupriavidus taiwanensis]
MNAFLVYVVSHSGVRMQFAAIARSRLDAQLDALDRLTEPPRFCCARALGRAE